MKDTYISFRKGYKTTITTPSEPLLGGIEDFLPASLFQGDSNLPSSLSRSAILDELIHYWSTTRPEGFNPQNLTLQAPSYYPLKITAAEWVNYVTVMCFALKPYEYYPPASSTSTLNLDNLSSALLSLQSWPWRVISSQTAMRAVIRFIKRQDAPGSSNKSWAALLEDYEYLATNIAEHGRQLDAMVPLVTTFLQLAETQQSLTEAKNVTQLTILALVFVPLSFVAGLFSMQESIAPGGPQFWLYFAVAVPIMLAVLAVARPPVGAFRYLSKKLGSRAQRTLPK